MRISDWSSDVCSSDLLLAIPDVKASFLTLAIGIQRRVVTTVGRAHLSLQPTGNCLGSGAVMRLATQCRGPGVQRQQQCAVVQHFFEMRDFPARIDAVAAEAARELIVDAALGHAHQAVQRSEEHTSELQSLMRNSYAVFCLKKKKKNKN